MGGACLTPAIVSINAFAAVLAWMVVRRTREHVWAAALVTWMCVSDLARTWSTRARGTLPHPLHGVPRIALHVDQILVASWTFPFLAACALYFLRRRSVAIAALSAWGVMSVAFVASYPALVGAPLFALYRVLFWFGVASSWLMILLGVFGDRALKPRLAHLVLILYAAIDLVGASFPYLGPLLREKWNDVQWLNVVTVSACAAFHLVALARGRLAEEAAA